MRWSHWTMALIISMGTAPAVAGDAAAQAAAFASGQQSGSKAALTAARSKITTSEATSNIEGFTSNPPQTGYVNSLSNMITGGNNKISGCPAAGAGTGAGTTADQNHCEAVNALAKQVTSPKKITLLRTDPLLLKGKSITDDPESIAGAMNAAYSACKTTTTTDPPPFEMQTCEDFAQISTETCRIGLEVAVDPDYLYQCHATLKVMQASQCTMGRVVKVDKKYNYQCQVSPKKINQYSCHVRSIPNVTLQPGANCPIGTMQQLQASSSGMAQDACDGGDWLKVYYPCGYTDNPSLKYETNGHQAAVHAGTVSINGTSQIAFGICRVDVTSSGSCTNGSCNINIAAAVCYYGGGRCNYTGTLNVNGAFKTYETLITMTYDNQCQSFEQRAQ